MTNYEYGVQDSAFPDKLLLGPTSEKTVDAWLKVYEEEEGKLDGLHKVFRPVSEWRKWEPPVDYSVTQEELDSMDHVIGEVDNGYLKHAYELTDTLKAELLDRGFKGYFGRLRGGGDLRVLCRTVKPRVWNRQSLLQRGDITELDNEVRETYMGDLNTVCSACQREVRTRRMEFE